MRRCAPFLSLLLITALLLGLCPGAAAAADGSDIIFLAFNDAMPYALSGGTMPYWSGGTLYVHSTTFDITSLSLSASYNAGNMTLLLYNSSTKRSLTFYLADGYVQTQNGSTDAVTASMRGDQVFLPLEYCAGFFGLGVSYLTSLSGWPLVRLTTGAQVWEDMMFIEKADKLINERAEKYMASFAPPPPPPQEEDPPPEQHDDPPVETDDPPTEDPPQDDPEPLPEAPTVYPALVGIAAIESALPLLESHDLKAAIYLTADEILANGDLVRRLYAAGHSIGLAGDPAEANDALDLVLCRRSLMLLDQTDPQYLCRYSDPGADPMLLRLEGDCADQLAELLDAGASMLLLRETTVLFTEPPAPKEPEETAERGLPEENPE